MIGLWSWTDREWLWLIFLAQFSSLFSSFKFTQIRENEPIFIQKFHFFEDFQFDKLLFNNRHLTGGQKNLRYLLNYPLSWKKYWLPMIGLWSWTDREWTWLRYLEPKKFMIVSEYGSYFNQVNVSDRGSWKMWTFPSLDIPNTPGWDQE